MELAGGVNEAAQGHHARLDSDILPLMKRVRGTVRAMTNRRASRLYLNVVLVRRF